MKTSWNYFNPVRVVAGAGCFEHVGTHIEAWVNNDKAAGEGSAQTWLVVTTAGTTRRGLTHRLIAQLAADTVHVFDEVTPNPELNDLQALTEQYRDAGIMGMVALGGGSALDAAKVLSVTLADRQHRSLRDCLTGNQSWDHHLPVITLPTTSGTGSEVTPFATVWDTTVYRKYSVAGEAVFPAMAVLDPTLTLSLPYQETLYTGLDATSHALESLWNHNATPISRAYAMAALQNIVQALPTVLADGDDLPARERMQQASMLSGLAISQTRTAIAHSISYPITSRFGAPHGLACSFTLPYLIVDNLPRLPADHRPLLEQVLALLQSLGLDEEIRKYVGDADLLALRDEMHTPNRAGNYLGEIDLDKIITNSF